MSTQPKADDNPADLDKIRADAAAAAVRADRERRGAIMALEEAKGREALADHLYMTGSTVEAAKATLAVSPKAAAEPAPTNAAEPNPQAYADERARAAAGLAAPTGDAKGDITSRILANYRTVTGAPAKTA